MHSRSEDYAYRKSNKTSHLTLYSFKYIEKSNHQTLTISPTQTNLIIQVILRTRTEAHLKEAKWCGIFPWDLSAKIYLGD